ncbi:MAG: 4Fe-4S dicluster domain-containing protein [Coriobacteriia bacterium]|nr:4Fe-4S dicluster domain-containing protein [Coriobacteriia bacterium]
MVDNTSKSTTPIAQGYTDFNAGTPVVSSMYCLRNAKLPTDCTLCLDGCPTKAITIKNAGDFEHFNTLDSCLKCGACVTMCPAGAISMTRQTVQGLNTSLLNASFKTHRIIITCMRTEALSLAAKHKKDEEKELERAGAEATEATDTTASAATAASKELIDKTATEKTKDQKAAKKAAKKAAAAEALAAATDDETDDSDFIEVEPVDYELIGNAQKKEMIVKVSCLSVISPEVWFSILNELSFVTTLKNVDILLPIGQCSQCPVNADGTIENYFEQAISKAENWAGFQVGILTNLNNMGLKSGRLLDPLLNQTSHEAEYDRRGAFLDTFKGLKEAWDNAYIAAEEASFVKLTPAQETAIKRERRCAYQKTLLGQRTKSTSTSSSMFTNSHPNASKSRDTVRIPPKRFILIEALGRNPVNAPYVNLPVSTTNKKLCIGCGECIKACAIKARYFDENAKVTAAAVASAATDPLICLGCGACVKVCRKKACHMTTVPGTAFLL